MITWVMVGLLLAAETCGRNVLSGNGNGKEESKQKDGLKGVATEEEDIYHVQRMGDRYTVSGWWPRLLQIAADFGQSWKQRLGEQELCEQHGMRPCLGRLHPNGHAADLHQLLRPELLQHRVADQRHQRHILAETARQIEVEAQTTREKRGRGQPILRGRRALAPGLTLLCISLLRKQQTRKNFLS
ncbi:uncharacterized protein LOC122530236 isoform X3 [Frieseomelitta varia]|uniref:uncharacterized protein LOC122530236 isoform X3 n=1 Tax=Frieseomelitta varia TaxID=561572 RepID=UPI001CB67C24|nr:uncharacterized protein LOC122530236 isoform X3 [Frieseomelitta varia]